MSYYKSRFKVGDVVRVRKQARSIAKCSSLSKFINRRFRITRTEDVGDSSFHATGHVQWVDAETLNKEFSASMYSGYFFVKVTR